MGQNSPAESEPLCSQIRMKAPFQPVASWIPLTVIAFYLRLFVGKVRCFIGLFGKREHKKRIRFIEMLFLKKWRNCYSYRRYFYFNEARIAV